MFSIRWRLCFFLMTLVLAGQSSQAQFNAGFNLSGFGQASPAMMSNQIYWGTGVRWQPYLRYQPVLSYYPVPYRYPIVPPYWGQQFGSPYMSNPMFPMSGNPMQYAGQAIGGIGSLLGGLISDIFGGGSSRSRSYSYGSDYSYSSSRYSRYSGRSTRDFDRNYNYNDARYDRHYNPPSTEAEESVPVVAESAEAIAAPTPIAPVVAAEEPHSKKEKDATPDVAADVCDGNCEVKPQCLTPSLLLPDDDVAKICNEVVPVKSGWSPVCDVMRVAYQNCNACLIGVNRNTNFIGYLDDKIDERSGGLAVDMDAVRKTHPYIKDNLLSPVGDCPNPKKEPLLFAMEDRNASEKGTNATRGKPQIRSGKIDLFATPITQKAETRFGLDCSGFVSAVFARQGWKMRANGEPFLLGTNEMLGLANSKDKNSCLSIPEFKKGQTDVIKPGDMIVRNGHAMIIDGVEGDDPFHIKDAKTKDDCHYQNFAHPNLYENITVAQSNSTFGGMGPLRVKLSELLSREIYSDLHLYYLNSIALMAQRACLVKVGVSSEKTNGLVSRTDYFGIMTGHPAYEKDIKGSIALIRHKASSDPRNASLCTTKGYDFNKPECVGCVNEKRTAKPANSKTAPSKPLVPKSTTLKSNAAKSETPRQTEKPETSKAIAPKPGSQKYPPIIPTTDPPTAEPKILMPPADDSLK